MKVSILVLFFMQISLWSNAQLVISEICASNKSSYIDDNGDSPDWIELHNRGNTVLDLTGYYISDNKDYNEKWRFPSVSIGPDEFLIVLADGQDKDEELRSSFKLSKLGEEVILYDENKNLLDHLIYPQLKSDITYGRVGDMLSFLEPSPGEKNTNQDRLNRLSKPMVNLEGGVYLDSQELIFSHSDTNAEIRYKLNNRSKKKEFVYDGTPLQITENTCICYWAENEDDIDSPVSCTSFFIGDEHSLDIISVTGDSIELFSWEEGLFQLGPNADAHWPHWGANFWSHEEVPVHFEYIKDGQLVYDSEAALQMHGGREARNNPMRSFRMVANKFADQRFEYPFYSNKPDLQAVKKLVVRNASGDFNAAHVRDGFLADYFAHNDLDFELLGYEPVVCYLNGTYYGVMGLREKADEYFINQNKHLALNDFDLLDADTMVILGNAQEYIDLHEFARNNDLSVDANYNKLAEQLDIPSLIDYLTVELGLNNKAWWHQNIRYWKEKDDGKWRFILFDMDIAMNRYSWTHYTEDIIHQKITSYQDTNLHCNIFVSMMDNENFRRQFANRHQDIFNTVFQVDTFTQALTEAADLIRPEMPRQFATYPEHNSLEEWEGYYLANMYEYIQERPAYARQHLTDFFDLGAPAAISVESNRIDKEFDLNTLKDILFPFEGYYFEDVPIELTAEDSGDFSYWSLMRNGEERRIYTPSISISIKDGDQLVAVYGEGSGFDQEVYFSDRNLYVHNIGDAESLRLYSMDGRLVWEKTNLLLGRSSFPIDHLPAACYAAQLFKSKSENSTIICVP